MVSWTVESVLIGQSLTSIMLFDLADRLTLVGEDGDIRDGTIGCDGQVQRGQTKQNRANELHIDDDLQWAVGGR